MVGEVGCHRCPLSMHHISLQHSRFSSQRLGWFVFTVQLEDLIRWLLFTYHTSFPNPSIIFSWFLVFQICSSEHHHIAQNQPEQQQEHYCPTTFDTTSSRFFFYCTLNYSVLLSKDTFLLTSLASLPLPSHLPYLHHDSNSISYSPHSFYGSKCRNLQSSSHDSCHIYGYSILSLVHQFTSQSIFQRDALDSTRTPCFTSPKKDGLACWILGTSSSPTIGTRYSRQYAENERND